MKSSSRLILALTVIAFMLVAQYSFGQFTTDLKILRQDETIRFDQIHEKYQLKKDIPTVVITWSGKWCMPCIQLIEFYNLCDPNMINLITVNIDAPEVLNGILDKGYDQKWNNAVNFHGNLGNSQNGFNNVFNATLAPLVLYLEDEKITDILTGYYHYPYTLITTGKIPDEKLVWNSWNDLNSLAWNVYQKKSSREDIDAATRWILRSIELDKNYYNMDTYAGLLFKTGEYTLALKTAKNAIEIAKANEIKHEATTELINKIIEKL